MIFGIVAILALILFLVCRNPRRRQQSKLRKLPAFSTAIIYAGGKRKRGLAISPSAAQFAVTHKWRRPSVYRFDDIVAVEVLRNGDAVTTTDRGSQIAGAAVGAVLLGPVGLLLGGLTARRSQSQKVRSLVLRIMTSDPKSPIVDIPFLTAKAPGLDAGSKELQRTSTAVAEWQGRFLSAMRVATLAGQDEKVQKDAPYSSQG